jgi:cardiolipin synthase
MVWNWLIGVLVVLDLLLRLGFSIRVIMRRRPVGVSLAWLTIILILPLIGILIYLLFGELRLGTRRVRRSLALHEPYHRRLRELRQRSHVDWSAIGPDSEPLARMIENVLNVPTQSGNALELLEGADDTLDALIADIDSARHTCHLEFYIWQDGGRADDVAETLMRAAARGVDCRVLVDAVGSRDFLNGPMPKRLRDGGVAVAEALPVNLLRMLFVRFDLRLHRKIVVIDGEVAYTGSLNLVDPRFFKREAQVGEWIDAMVRLRGPAVEVLAAIFAEDWEMDTGEGLESLPRLGMLDPQPACGPAAVQVIPSGPLADRERAMQAILLLAIYRARRELVLTTPYFVPDEVMLTALMSAALRGVEVTLVVPSRVDSRLVEHAARASDGDLLLAGVRVMRFEGGLLHTKSVTVDGELSLFGTLNLDPRSFYLNFEITLAVYDADFTTRLRALQQTYIDRSRLTTYETWQTRPPMQRFIDNSIRLLSPLL